MILPETLWGRQGQNARGYVLAQEDGVCFEDFATVT